MAKYLLPELSFDEALRQLQVAHQFELLHARSGGCRTPPVALQLPRGHLESNLASSSRILMATGERAHAKTNGEGLEHLVGFMEDLPIRHMHQALRKLPRAPPNPSDVLDNECLDEGKCPESPRPARQLRITEGTVGVMSGNFIENLCSPQSVMQCQNSMFGSLERWAALMEAVISERSGMFEVHKIWSEGRPQDLGQALGVSVSYDKALSGEGQMPMPMPTQEHSVQLPSAMVGILGVKAATTDRFSSVLYGSAGTNFHHGWALHPNSQKRLVWDIAGVIVCLYDLITFPMQMVRLISEVASIALCFTMYWTLDIFMSCISGFFTKDGLMELRVPQVVKQYMRTWMVLDIGLCIFDWLSSCVEMADTGAIRLVRSYLRFIRIVRVLRLLKIVPRLKAQFGQINSDYISTWARLVLYICFVVMMNHYIACLFCSVWSQLSNPNKQYRYVSALHWALSHCLLGSMDLTPDTVGERILTCSVLVISMVVFATLLSNITEDTANLQALSAEKKKRESVVRKFFSENSLPPELVCRVWHVIQRNDLASGGRLKENHVEMFNMLPQYLQKEIRFATFTPLLVNHPFFEFYHDTEPKAVRMLCNCGVKQMRILPYEQLAWPSRAGVNLMLFVATGELRYFPNDLPSFKLPCPAGRWALEATLWAKHAILEGTLSSDSEPCELMLVVPSEFHDVAKIHYGSMHILRVYAREFVREFNDACARFEQTELLFNTDAIIIELLEEVRNQCEVRSKLITSVRKQCFFHSGTADHHIGGFLHERKRTAIDKHIYESP